jgi:ABC-type microcin C transport system permease subunit YejB
MLRAQCYGGRGGPTPKPARLRMPLSVQWRLSVAVLDLRDSVLSNRVSVRCSWQGFLHELLAPFILEAKSCGFSQAQVLSRNVFGDKMLMLACPADAIILYLPGILAWPFSL